MPSGGGRAVAAGCESCGKGLRKYTVPDDSIVRPPRRIWRAGVGAGLAGDAQLCAGRLAFGRGPASASWGPGPGLAAAPAAAGARHRWLGPQRGRRPPGLRPGAVAHGVAGAGGARRRKPPGAPPGGAARVGHAGGRGGVAGLGLPRGGAADAQPLGPAALAGGGGVLRLVRCGRAARHDAGRGRAASARPRRPGRCRRRGGAVCPRGRWACR